MRTAASEQARAGCHRVRAPGEAGGGGRRQVVAKAVAAANVDHVVQ